MFWWVLSAVAIAVPVVFLAVFLWSSGDPVIDQEIARETAKKLFQDEQDYRWQRRAGKSD
jgi:hypothetical protein